MKDVTYTGDSEAVQVHHRADWSLTTFPRDVVVQVDDTLATVIESGHGIGAAGGGSKFDVNDPAAPGGMIMSEPAPMSDESAASSEAPKARKARSSE